MRTPRIIVAVALVAAACSGEAITSTAETRPPNSDTELAAERIEPSASTPTPTDAAPVATDPRPSETPATEPPVWPPPRIHPVLLPDPVSGDLLMVGGSSRMQRSIDMRDMWLLDSPDLAWTEIGDVAPNDAFDFGIDTQSGHLVAFNLTPGETWTFDLQAGGPWVQQQPDVQPESTIANPRFGASLTYDAESDRLIMFGGGSPWHMYTDTWAYDADSATWEAMSPESSPSPRAMYATAYDAASDRVLLWGGFTGTDENDVRMWAYDYNSDTWEALDNSDGPQQHPERHGMAYVPELDSTLVYSGMLEDEGVLPAETWFYDYDTNTWTDVAVETSPPAMAMYGMAYDQSTGMVVLYGGEMTSKYAGDLSSDIWVFDPTTSDWAQTEAPIG